MGLKAVIFDFDGVITDSEILHLRAFNYVLKQYGLKISKKEYYKNFLGFSDIDLFNLLNRKGIIQTNPHTIQELIKQKNQHFEELSQKEGKLIEGVKSFITMLSEAGIPIAIYSGALLPEIELVLEDASLKDRFHTIISSEMVTKGKPDPEGFLLALNELNRIQKILPGECIVIEDSHWGLQAADDAGMHTIAVTNSYPAEQLQAAERVVSRLDKLTVSDLEKLCL